MYKDDKFSPYRAVTSRAPAVIVFIISIFAQEKQQPHEHYWRCPHADVTALEHVEVGTAGSAVIIQQVVSRLTKPYPCLLQGLQSPCLKSTWSKTKQQLEGSREEHDPGLHQQLHAMQQDPSGTLLLPCLHSSTSKEQDIASWVAATWVMGD